MSKRDVRRGPTEAGSQPAGQAAAGQVATGQASREVVHPTSVAVIATVFNEVATVGRLLDSLRDQTLRPDEVIIVDGGSTDGTLELLREREAGGDLPLRVLSVPGANISAGRNAAIAASRSELIAAIDAGVTASADWLERLIEPLAGGREFVGGFFIPDPRTPFEVALAAATLPEVSDIDAHDFLPSSRSAAFTRSAWRVADGYPEWLDYCEDLVFDLRLIAQTGPVAFVPAATVRFRPRPTLAAFARQYFNYARGDGKAWLWPARHAVRYAVYLVAVPALVVTAAAHPLGWIALLAGAALMLRRSFSRLGQLWARHPSLMGGWRPRLESLLWIPLIRVTGDVAKMVGFVAGLVWRARHRPPAWRPHPSVGWR